MEPERPHRIAVLVVDDHPAVREGLRLLLAREEIAVCADAEGRSTALEALDRVSPHVALVDLLLGAESGFGLITELSTRGLPVLVYSMYEDGEHLRQALAAGARGYVSKREMHRVLVDGIRELAAGRTYLGPRAAAALAADLVRSGKQPAHRDLSEREQEVYRQLGEGATTSEIAAVMHVSIRTVESYCARIMEKLGVEGMRPLRRDAILHVHDGSK